MLGCKSDSPDQFLRCQSHTPLKWKLIDNLPGFSLICLLQYIRGIPQFGILVLVDLLHTIQANLHDSTAFLGLVQIFYVFMNRPNQSWPGNLSKGQFKLGSGHPRHLSAGIDTSLARVGQHAKHAARLLNEILVISSLRICVLSVQLCHVQVKRMWKISLRFWPWSSKL